MINFGGSLSISKSEFATNNATGPLIYSHAGELSISNTTFLNNVNSPTHVFVGNASELVSNTGNCGSEVFNCSGIYFQESDETNCLSSECGGECTVFDLCFGENTTYTPVDASGSEEPSAAPSTSAPTAPLQAVECPSNSTLIGYVDMDSLQADLINGVTEFQLCPESLITGSLALRINNMTLVIECFDNSCVWIGNKFHVRLEGEGFGFRASGITFRDATEDSVVLRYDIDSAPNFLMEDCVWEDNAGSGVFILIHGTTQTSRERSSDIVTVVSGRHRHHSDKSALQEEKHDLNRCVFSDNKVEEVLFIQDAPISLSNCTFRDNVANGSMIAAFDSSLSILSTTFLDNTFDSIQGLLYVMGDSIIIKDDGVCTLSNVPLGDKCQGILQGGGDCTELPECVIDCLDSWDKLVADVEASQQTLVLCANTTIDVPEDTPLMLEMKKTVLQCGREGLRSDGCVLSGGSDQVVIAASGIEIIGVTFIGSSRISVRGEADRESVALIRDCEFRGHTGVGVLLIDRDGETFLSSGENLLLSGSDGSEKQSMSLEVENCLIIDNAVALAPILVMEGSLVVSSSVFQENEAGVGSIAAFSSSTLGVSSSCFLGNTGKSAMETIASTVFVEASSELTRNDGNFGIGNKVESDYCADGVTQAGHACIPFTARFCESSTYNESGTFTKFSSCINDFQALTALVSELNSSIEIEICPLTVFDLNDQNLLHLLVERSDITISCGRDGSRQNDCRFTGGDKQVEIVGNVTNVILKGLTFVGATKSSVMIEGSSPLSVEFFDCAWEETKGESAVVVTSLDPPTDSPTSAPTSEQDDTDDIFRLLEKVGFEVLLTRCSFERNEVTSSLIFSKGASLDVQSCSFSSNSVGDSIVTTESGRLVLKSTCFEEEGFLVTSDGSSSIESESNYAASTGTTEASICAGIFDTTSDECESFNSTFCEAPIEADCFGDWYSLSQAVGTARTLGKGSVFTLCQDTIFNVDRFNPIELDVDDTVIQCGSSGALENRCTIIGGAVQFRVTGDVTFRGINMLNSSVAAIHAGGEDSRVTSIDNCLFSGHSGLAAVISYLGDIRSQPGNRQRRTQEGRLPETGPTMTVDVTDSVFVQNSVKFAPLSIMGGTLVLNSTTFTENNGSSTAVGIWFGGNLLLSPSCFNDQGAAPSVFVDAGSTIDGLDPSTTGDKASSGNCTGILSGDDCLPIQEQNCGSDAFLPPQECYDSWVDLSKAITSSLTQDRDDISFSICENTTLDVDEDVNEEATPIVVAGVQVEIKCGEGGSRDDNCVIRGGRSHFKLVGSGTTTFIGLTFEKASFASVLAAGEASSVATFTHCTWRQNDGQTTVLINSQLDPDIDIFVEDLADLVESSGTAMTVLTDKCIFENNDVDFGVITNIGGDLNLLETVMVNNRDARFGVIAGINGATVGLSYTCFTGNSAVERGIVFLDQSSTLAFNRNAFASNNGVSLGECSSIFLETDGSCAKNSTCQGDCDAFESRTCRVASFTADSTVEPTATPSLNPTISPATPKPGAGEAPETKDPSSDSGGNKSGILVAAILVPLLLIALGVGFVVYKRRKIKVGQDSKDDKFEDEGEVPAMIGGDGDGSQSRSKTQAMDEEMDEDDHSEFEDVEITAPLNPKDLPHSEERIKPGDEIAESFEDEDVQVDSVAPLSPRMGRLGGMINSFAQRSARSKSPSPSSDGGDIPPPKEFVRVPRTLGKKQRSEDIMAFQSIPTTF